MLTPSRDLATPSQPRKAENPIFLLTRKLGQQILFLARLVTIPVPRDISLFVLHSTQPLAGVTDILPPKSKGTPKRLDSWLFPYLLGLSRLFLEVTGGKSSYSL